MDCPTAVQQNRNPLGIDVQQIKAFARSWCSNYAILYVYQKPSQCGDLLALLKVSKNIILMSHYDCYAYADFSGHEEDLISIEYDFTNRMCFVSKKVCALLR